MSFSKINKDVLLIIFSYLDWQEFCDCNINDITLSQYLKVCPNIPTIDEICSKKKEYLEMVKILLMNDHSIKIRTLEKATKNNHINIVKFLCHNKNILPKLSICNSMRVATQEGHLELVKFLHSQDACCITSCMEIARMNGYFDIYKYFLKKKYVIKIIFRIF